MKLRAGRNCSTLIERRESTAPKGRNLLNLWREVFLEWTRWDKKFPIKISAQYEHAWMLVNRIKERAKNDQKLFAPPETHK
jgi:hypothetical protein